MPALRGCANRSQTGPAPALVGIRIGMPVHRWRTRQVPARPHSHPAATCAEVGCPHAGTRVFQATSVSPELWGLAGVTSTEVVPHAQLLDRTVGLATQICEADAPIMQGLKAIYVAGAAAIIDPALAAEQRMAAAAAGHTDGLGERYRQVAERNRRQIDFPIG
jgi:hypothetical protein